MVDRDVKPLDIATATYPSTFPSVMAVVQKETYDSVPHWEVCPVGTTNHFFWEKEATVKLIASNNPHLKDIPQLPEIKEDIVAALAKIGLNNPTAGEVGAYKAASKKKYTEEDMIIAMMVAGRWGNLLNKSLRQLGEDMMNTRVPKYLASLTQQPIAIECEMVKWPGETWMTVEYEPKVDKDNKITGRYIYE